MQNMEEMQYLGAFEILKETFKIINKNRKIFVITALCFIQPFNVILPSLIRTFIQVLRNFNEYGNISLFFSHIWSLLQPFEVVNMVFLFGISIFTTACLSHIVAAIYTGREPTHNCTLNAGTKIWKRVFITLLCSLLVVLAYHVIAGFALLLLIRISSIKIHGTTFVVFLVFYFVGLLYLVVVFQLAGVVSALEDLCGFTAMQKSRSLLMGKMASATVLVLAFWSTFGILVWFDDIVGKMLFSPLLTVLMYVSASLSIQLLNLVLLSGKLVSETVLYFVCKSYHREGIDYILPLLNQDHMPTQSSEC